MLATSASRPAMFRETMRRVRLEKLSVNRNCPARLSHPSGRRQPLSGGLSRPAMSAARDDERSSATNPGAGCVRSSNGQHLLRVTGEHPYPSILAQASRGVSAQARMCPQRESGFLEAIPHAVERFDHLEIIVHDLEFLAQPFDVAVDGAVVDIDL